jgi:hypothetical protein
MRRVRIFLGAALAFAAAAGAVVPQQWSLRSFNDFIRGKFDGISASSEGALFLAPKEDRIEGPSEDFYLSFLMTPEGVGYLGTGHNGKIYRLAKDGKTDLYFQTSEMDVTCLLLGPKGILFAATSPNGKIYKITAAGKGEEFFNPAERYIWDLLLAENGNVLAAVGESGGLYEINPLGQGRQVFKSEPSHLLCLKFDRNGDILAGSGGPGLVYRIMKNGGKGVVVFETPFEEVRTLALDLDGRIYAAAGGTVKGARAESVSAAAPPVATGNVEVSISAMGAASVPSAAGGGSTVRPASAGAASREPGAVFRIGPDGLAKRIWFSPDELVYSLFWDEAGKKVLFGTGPKGRLYETDGEEDSALVLQSGAEQISACLPLGSRLYLLSNNPSGLTLVSPGQRMSGEYLGPVWDARLVAGWGRIEWEAAVPTGAILQFQSRSGNMAEPGASWSDWSPPYQKPEGEQMLSPKARYLQVRALFKAQSAKAAPTLNRLTAHFLPSNAAPAITRLELLGPNEVYLKPPDLDEAIWGLERRRPEAGTKKDEIRIMTAKKVERPGFRTIVWDAEDVNGDALVYSILLKRDGEKDWRLIEDLWTDEIYAFNTAHFPDGVYSIKVTVSDGTSNPSEQAKRGEKIVGPLLVDNAAPEVKNLQAVRAGGFLNVSFQAEDGFSPIKDARFLLRPGDWQVVFPEDGIADSKIETYQFQIPLKAGADNLLTIIVRDAVNNTVTIRRLF